MPPEKVWMRRSMASVSPTSSVTSTTWSPRILPLRPQSLPWRVSSSRPVCLGSRPASWRATPMSRHRGRLRGHVVAQHTAPDPLVGWSRVVRMRTMVDLPAPLGPRKP